MYFRILEMKTSQIILLSVLLLEGYALPPVIKIGKYYLLNWRYYFVDLEFTFLKLKIHFQSQPVKSFTELAEPFPMEIYSFREPVHPFSIASSST